MIVMPANSCGWFWHALARETGRLGHLFSPGGQRGPWPWFPYALDNGAFACWRPTKKRATGEVVSKDQRKLHLDDTAILAEPSTFDDEKWAVTERAWHRLVVWAQTAAIKPMWAIVPDVPGNAAETFARWSQYAPKLLDVPRALAVQDGMTTAQVQALVVQPDVIAVGGTTEWKWATVERWAKAFPRVHLLRCNAPARLYDLEEMGVESCDGTGWSRGDRTQTSGLEAWARSKAKPITSDLWPFVCRAPRSPKQETFA